MFVENNSNGNILEFNSVNFSYGATPVLQNINLQIKRGEMRVIIGPNGGGKSTLLKLALGLVKKSSGSVKLLGRNVERFNRWRKVGYVPQLTTDMTSSLYPATAGEVIAQGFFSAHPIRRIFNRKTPAEKESWDKVVEITGAGGFLKRPFAELSTGERQRVLLARALIKSPQIMLLDEPVASIDSGGKSRLNDVLVKINRYDKVSIVMVTHDLGLVSKSYFNCACLNCSLSYDGPASLVSDEHLTSVYGYPVKKLEQIGNDI